MTKPEVLDAYLNDALARHDHWISVADAKAGALLVTIPALLALYGSTLIAEAKSHWNGVRDWGGLCHEALPLVYLGLIGLTALSGSLVLWFSFQALDPRVIRASKQRGMVFFGDIAQEKLQVYEADVLRLQADELRKDYIEQVHATAKIAATKFQHVKWSIRWAVGFILMSIATYVPSIV
jgi:hypothetical protein